ncbi:MAG TPA: glycosyltransferase family 4 protein [Solirubrobacteraceae bacterium]|jgi:glycosyltransferase involved in cell wall biosynthesis
MSADETGNPAVRLRALVVEEGGIGGVAEYTNELVGAIGRAGCEVHLAAGRDNAFGEAPNVIVHRLFPYVRGRSWPARAVRAVGLSRPVNGASHLGADVLLAKLARTCDVVHVQGEEWPPLGAAQALMLRAARAPMVYSPHNTFDRSARSYPRSHALIRRCAARIIVHSEFDRRALSAALAAKTVVIPHGEYGGLARRGQARIEASTVRTQLGIAEEELLVLLFGQLRRDKGVRDLLEAAARAPGVTVVLAGEDHGALAEVAALLEDRRLRGRVRVLRGFVAPDRAGELFAAADVVALPYLRASASGVLLLAYGYGRPVLAYPVGGLPEYVEDGRTGWLCERADVAALTEELQAVAAAGRGECQTRGEAARAFSEEHFSWDAIARRTVALYEEVSRDARRAA